ncbi:MAG: NADH:flavin oxidoreductase [Syntrophales bacterium]|jgi:2,4-dienoyl-CoA reductase-like NADH-dependent reductase (Old Yellow Enzyme family)|nr:NADH:flavin oxidoreductase [Syntrophales bacterium]MDX9922870.1 NADH:flavin oxidoreductase [Syntrophales bacterium]
MKKKQDSSVFTPGKIGSLELKNRLIRSATFENAATIDGKVSENLIDIHRSLAKGGVGLIIAGISWINPKTQAQPFMARVDDDSFIPGLKKLTSTIHEISSDCRIMIQLHHPGRQVINQADLPAIHAVCPRVLRNILKNHTTYSAGEENTHHYMEPTAPSSIYDPLFERTPRSLILEEVDNIIDYYANAVRRSEEAGFDGVQLHAAHGWLLSSFLSPATNQRSDIYGGSTENRTRIVTEIYQRARKKVANDFPILVKFNATDFILGGMEIDEAVRVARILSKSGFAAVEVSGGMWEATTRKEEELGWHPVLLPESRTGLKNIDQEAYFLPLAEQIKENTDNTVISVGGYRSFNVIERAIESQKVDFISLSRPLIRQPNLPNLWLTEPTVDKAECISCNACLPIGTSEPVTCRAK